MDETQTKKCSEESESGPKDSENGKEVKDPDKGKGDEKEKESEVKGADKGKGDEKEKESEVKGAGKGKGDEKEKESEVKGADKGKGDEKEKESEVKVVGEENTKEKEIAKSDDGGISEEEKRAEEVRKEKEKKVEEAKDNDGKKEVRKERERNVAKPDEGEEPMTNGTVVVDSEKGEKEKEKEREEKGKEKETTRLGDVKIDIDGDAKEKLIKNDGADEKTGDSAKITQRQQKRSSGSSEVQWMSQFSFDEAPEESIPLNNKEAEDKKSEKDAQGGLPARWITAILGCIGFMIVYGLKVNLSVAIIAMVNHTAVAELTAHHGDHEEDHHDGTAEGNSTVSENQCGVEEKKEDLLDGPFVWDDNIQGLILASYFYGYIFTQVPGGWVAEKFSAKHVFGLGTLANAVLALLTPVAASGSYIWVIVIRVGMGIAGGVTLPGMHVLIANWAPPQERSKIASTIYAGMTLGTLVCMPFSGLLAATVDWSAIFYVQGGLSILWYVLWLIFVYDTPAKHPRISVAERTYIESSMGTVTKSEKPPVPWKSVWTSMPVWAIIVAHTCSNWGWYMLLVKLPTYMRYILKFDIKANAGISAVPFLCMWIFTMILANLLDALRSRKLITTTFARKLATFLASVPPAVCLIGVTYVGCNTDLAVVLLTLGTMFVGAMYSGFLSNHIDIAPPFAGTLMGITNTFATVPGIVVPSFVGYMTHGNQTVEAWRTIFFITLGIFGLEAIFFCIFGSGEEQPWAKPQRKADPEEQRLNEGL
ncbi:sialin-like isoform X4 [Macrobrachium rosenbergii]|uniref:sialin-like isoform X4 n=1 Tax=Macrobrachium rosenbergii TaxID=79674 RepID=UPI0034D42C68